ncbi:MAG TPA: nucleoside-triphosphatase [Candidatus Bathyarchaeia archaeon]|nr:nucleoside-triphosphatase [Candidatus Bathyarchaeia archaeon]
MKILLTGRPGIGKSTILQKFRGGFTGKIYGIVARELRDEDNNRVGFSAENSAKKEKVFAHKYKIKSEFIVGGKYHVDIKAIDDFVVPEIKRGIQDPDSVILIDEIGRMQSFSKLFMQAIRETLNSECNILATIVFDPEPWSIEFKKHPGAVLIEVDETNREILPELLLLIYRSISQINRLSLSQRDKFLQLTRQYFSQNQFIQIRKLFNNALFYVINKKIALEKETANEEIYRVIGKHDSHLVRLSLVNNNFYCDCDLFKGRKDYAGKVGECSHIQSVILDLIDKGDKDVRA